MGFAVSTHAHHGGSNRDNGGVRERSDIVWARILDYNSGTNGAEVIGYYINGHYTVAD